MIIIISIDVNREIEDFYRYLKVRIRQIPK